ncbi:hypothetical protein K1T71_014160 [Dendrolimus kikuchii]|uniref:Uncharacterized protein n=1 Tax=Dendrolimus kikuchii TaxID=765133 RepID=A0ACC1CFH3_9NEOP|nr:hypothetical protein K1T71_014160 [Dendrolimus kikuchii]
MFDMWNSVSSKLEAQSNVQSQQPHTSGGSIKDKCILESYTRGEASPKGFGLVCKRVDTIRYHKRTTTTFSTLVRKKKLPGQDPYSVDTYDLHVLILASTCYKEQNSAGSETAGRHMVEAPQ